MRATYLNRLSVVSVLLLTIVFTVFPARADVYITAAQIGEPCDGRVLISYDATTETNLVRAFALDIRLSNDANIIEVTGISDDYYIYPGTIQIDAQGNVMDFGSPVAEYSDLPSGTLTGLDSNGITIEMASLYAPTGPGSPNAPAKSGDLVEVKIGELCGPRPTNAGCVPFIPCSTCLTISANVARAGPTGVVMEDPNEVVNVNVPVNCLDISIPTTPFQCMKATSPDYGDWVEWDCPACWCYAKQCRGDINGSSFFGKPVTLSDLNLFKLAFNKTDAELSLVTDGICADLNHASFFGKRATISDLNMFKLYFNLAEASVPECDKTNYNWWETP